MTYTLSEDEMQASFYITRIRQNDNGRAGIRDQNFSGMDSFNIALVGMRGEIAFGRLFNVPTDWSIEPRAGGHDCEWKGHTVDVKTTTDITREMLMVPARKAVAGKSADIYALMIGDEATYTFKGWAFGDELFHPNNKRFFKIPTFAMPLDELSKRPPKKKANENRPDG